MRDQSCLPIDVIVNVEALVAHLHVEIGACVVFSKVDTLGVTLKNFLCDLRSSRRVRVSPFVVPLYPGFVFGELTKNVFGQQSETIGGHVDVVLNVLDHPPWRVTGIISRFVVKEDIVEGIKKQITLVCEQSQADWESNHASR